MQEVPDLQYMRKAKQTGQPDLVIYDVSCVIEQIDSFEKEMTTIMCRAESPAEVGDKKKFEMAFG